MIGAIAALLLTQTLPVKANEPLKLMLSISNTNLKFAEPFTVDAYILNTGKEPVTIPMPRPSGHIGASVGIDIVGDHYVHGVPGDDRGARPHRIPEIVTSEHWKTLKPGEFVRICGERVLGERKVPNGAINGFEKYPQIKVKPGNYNVFVSFHNDSAPADIPSMRKFGKIAPGLEKNFATHWRGDLRAQARITVHWPTTNEISTMSESEHLLQFDMTKAKMLELHRVSAEQSRKLAESRKKVSLK